MVTTKKWGAAEPLHGTGVRGARNDSTGAPARASSLCGMIAGTILSLALAGCAPAGPKALQTGERLLREGRAEEAIQPLQQAVMLLATNVQACAQAWNHLGLAYHQLGKYAQADKAYQNALARDRDLLAARYNRGCLFLEQTNLVSAIDELTTYTMHRPREPDGWLKLAGAQFRAGQYEAADLSYAQLIRLNRYQAEACNGLGLSQAARRRPREAMVCFQEALKWQTNYLPALLNQAVVAHQQMGDLPLALAKYRACLAASPDAPNRSAIAAIIKNIESQLAPAPPPPAPKVAVAPRPRQLPATNQALPARPSPKTAPPETNLLAVVPTPSPPAPREQAGPPPASPPGKPQAAAAPKTPPPPKPETTQRVEQTKPIESHPPPRVTPTVAEPKPPQAKTPPPRETHPQPAKPAPSPPKTPPQPVEFVKLTSEPEIKPARDLPPASQPPKPTIATQAPPPAITVTQAPPPVVVTSTQTPAPAVEAASPRPVSARKAEDARPAPGPQPAPLTTNKPVVSSTEKAEPAESKPVPAKWRGFSRYKHRIQRQAASGDRTEAHRFFAEGLTAYKSGNLDEAIAAYKKAAKADPSYFEANYNLGAAAYEGGNLAQAMRAYEDAVIISPANTNARFNFALTLQKAGYPVDAAQEFEKLIAANPDDAVNHYNLANLCAQTLRDSDTAREHYLKVLELQPRHPRASIIRQWLAASPRTE